MRRRRVRRRGLDGPEVFGHPPCGTKRVRSNPPRHVRARRRAGRGGGASHGPLLGQGPAPRGGRGGGHRGEKVRGRGGRRGSGRSGAAPNPPHAVQRGGTRRGPGRGGNSTGPPPPRGSTT